MNLRRQILRALVLPLALSYGAFSHASETFPSKPVKLVVPFPPGGITDVVARLVAPLAAERLGQPVVVENRAGAGGVLGTTQVSQAEPDGYTMMLGTISVLAIRPALTKVPYDASGSFDRLTLATRAPNVLVVHPDVPARTVPELVDFMKKNPGAMTFANSGTGSSDHLTTELFWQKTGVKGVHVPFQGSGPATINLLGGHTQASFRGLPDVVEHIKSGKLRLLSTETDARIEEFADAPTLAEAGVSGAEVYSWQGFVAPKGLPANVHKILNEALVHALNDARVKEGLKNRGIQAVPSTGPEFAAYQQSEIDRWKAVVKAGNITVDQ